MRPAFITVLNRYPRETRAVLYNQIGWDDVVDHPAYQDTCAIRMSLALLRSEVVIGDGTARINAGILKNRRIHTGQVRLSRALQRIWGRPEVYRGERAAKEGIGSRRGIVSFFRIRHFEIPTSGGHIDLVYRDGNNFQRCARSCYFDAAEVWFWELN